MSQTPNSLPPWSASTPPKKHPLRKILPLMIIACLITAAYTLFTPQPCAVETHTITTGPLNCSITEEGKTRIRNRYQISSPIAGTLARCPFKPGAVITAESTTLATITPPFSPLLDTRAHEQQSILIHIRELAVQQATNHLTACQSAAKLANADLSRARSLSTPNALSPSDIDRLASLATIKSSELQSAETALAIANQEWISAKNYLNPNPTTTTPCTLRSPINGKVLKVFQENETTVQPGTPLLEIGDPTDLEIEAEVLSKDATNIHLGDPVSIEHWGGTSPLSARVSRIEPTAFTKISALGVEEQRVIIACAITSPTTECATLGDRFRVDVKISTWSNPKVTIIPFSALFRIGNQWATYTLHHGIIHQQPVTIGHTNESYAEVLSGVSPGDTVVVHPPDTLKPGDSATSAPPTP